MVLARCKKSDKKSVIMESPPHPTLARINHISSEPRSPPEIPFHLNPRPESTNHLNQPPPPHMHHPTPPTWFNPPPPPPHMNQPIDLKHLPTWTTLHTPPESTPPPPAPSWTNPPAKTNPSPKNQYTNPTRTDILICGGGMLVRVGVDSGQGAGGSGGGFRW